MRTRSRATTGSALPSATALAVVALAAAAAGPGPADASAASRCRPAGSQLLAFNAKVVVYERRRVAYGCHRRSGRTVRLTNRPMAHLYYTTSRFRLAGTRVAYVITGHYYTGSQNSYDSRRQKIAVRDLAGRGVVRYAAGQDTRLAGWGGRPPSGVRDLELTSSGAVAWIIRDPEAQPRTLHVYVADAQGRRELDAGDGIGERSLRIEGGAVTWLHGGQPRSAPLADF